MDNIIESEKAERDDVCGCEGGPTLSVLKDVQKAYEKRIEVIHRVGGPKKFQKQVQVLESWVSDLVAQNTLLAQTVEELETEVTARLLIERRNHAEIECELRLEVATLRKQLSRKDSDLRGLLEVLRRLRQFDYCAIDGIHFNEVTQSDIFGPVVWNHPNLDQGDNKDGNMKLEYDKGRKISTSIIVSCSSLKCFVISAGIIQQNKNKTISDKFNEMKMINDSLKIENVSKEREIRRLNKDMQQYEQNIISLRNDLSKTKYCTPDVTKKDAEVSTDISCCGRQECGDIEPVKEVGVKQGDIEDINRRSKSLLALRQENVSLRHELHAMQGVLTALYEQCNVAELRTKFKDEIILEMRRQLRQAKVKLKEVTESRLSLQKEQDNEYISSSYHLSNTTCVQQQPRRKRRARPNMDLNINWETRDIYESGGEVSSKD